MSCPPENAKLYLIWHGHVRGKQTQVVKAAMIPKISKPKLTSLRFAI